MADRGLSFSSAVVLILTVSFTSCANQARMVGADSSSSKPSLVFYALEQYYNVTGSEYTNVLSAREGSDLLAMNFGDLALTEQVLRTGPNMSDPVVGNSPAFYYKNKKARSYTVHKLITLSTEKYNGTFVMSCVFQSLNDFTSSNEFAIAGGTGSFRDVGGYATVTLVSRAADHKWYKYEVFLTACRRYHLSFN
ncbi:protein MpDIR8 [Marchantia polymorpha subsp. ruderalis]|nr:hypothetical protein MARPO_0016s0063 [Marchantia polymorpha]BBN14264.1 hypothetical protein Mp_6g10200 [Marchantia polymorpha subsp. ruderalis]|eukprot:PTQ44999.1 hypothetical protein MARPO_0016s0063 [Marchantia polymorpha]